MFVQLARYRNYKLGKGQGIWGSSARFVTIASQPAPSAMQLVYSFIQ